MLLSHPEWGEIKKISGRVIGQVIPYYDISPTEAFNVLAAEQLYLPWIEPGSIDSILGSDSHQFIDALKSTASWERSDSKPKSVSGFIITLSNFMANELSKGISAEEIAKSVIARPGYLMHPAVRVVTEEKLIAIAEFVAGDIQIGRQRIG